MRLICGKCNCEMTKVCGYFSTRPIGNKQMQSRKETSDFVWKLKTANEQKTEQLTKAKNIISGEMKRFIKRLKYIFSYKCPECGGVLYYEEYDVACDRDIYKCSKCGELWF